MKPQFQHQVVTSFALWLDHVILSRGEAFQNIESTFYLQYDDRLDPEFISFASPHKQWVTDSSIESADVISGITLNGQYIPKNQKGIRYDYNNGRVIIPRLIADEQSTVEGAYAVKDFNIYITDQTEEQLLIETKFDKNSRFDQQVFDGVKPYDQVVPAIFISYEQGYNKPFAFGGQDTTVSQIRCVAFAENSFQLDGIFSIIKDLNFSTVANVGFNEHPLNEFGDLKYGIYDYADLSDRYYNVKNSTSIMHIEKVSVSKLNDKIAASSHPGLYIGFIDVDINAFRYPRAPLVEPTPDRAPNIKLAPVAPFCLTLGPQLPKAPECLTLNDKPYEPFNLELMQRVSPPTCLTPEARHTIKNKEYTLKNNIWVEV
jgi:hypothetical protein